MSQSKKDIRGVVMEKYGEIAAQGKSCCQGGCAAAAPDEMAQVIGYDPEVLKSLPENANMGLSCGNPGAIASLKEGETVLDLGSGAGFDVFIAAQKVGKKGRVIGVDMTAQMLAGARKNAQSFKADTGLDNVEFRLGEIEHLPVADNCVDAVISNCVINLSPDKAQVWREIARVLKPGGRAAISDLALLRPLPGNIKNCVEAYVGCIAGAELVENTRRMIREAGLEEISLNKKSEYIDYMSQNSQDPLYREIMAGLPEGEKPADYVTSLEISARKPKKCCPSCCYTNLQSKSDNPASGGNS